MGGFPRGVSSKPTGESTSPLWVGDLPKFCTIIERSIVSPSWHFLGSFHKGLRSIVSLVTIYFPSFVLAWRAIIGIVYVLKATRNLFYLTNNWIIMNHLTHRVNIYLFQSMNNALMCPEFGLQTSRCTAQCRICSIRVHDRWFLSN